jgi:hypothetical protein
MKSTMNNDDKQTTRPTMITADRYIKIGELSEGVIALLQIGPNGEALEAPARWHEEWQAYVHNGTGEVLAMYNYDQLRPQLEKAGIEHEPLTR